MKKKSMATMALGISIAGAVATQPFSAGSFLGGLVHNGFLAATIGGLADWFAVTALFRKPLGISFRTNILVRNRQRIMQAVVDFAADDLLSAENIMRFVEKNDTSQLMLAYLDASGYNRIITAAENIACESIKSLDPEAIAKRMSPVVIGLVEKGPSEELYKQLTDKVSSRETAERVFSILLKIARKLKDDQALKDMMHSLLEKILSDYREAVPSRSFAMALMKFDANSLMDTVMGKAEELLDSLETEAGELRREAAISWLNEALAKLARGPEAAGLFEDLKNRILDKERLEKITAEWLRSKLADNMEQLRHWTAEAVADKLDEFKISRQWQLKADSALKAWIRDGLEKHHDVIAAMVEERLNELSDEELVEFTETKVNDDLQMIRINGSVVGCMAGMLLYAAAYIVGMVAG